MKTKLLLAGVMLCYASCLSAQEKPADNFKHDIGFNTYFVLRGIIESEVTPFSLMYKRYTSETKAIRLGIDASLSITNNSGDPNVPSSDYSNNSFVAIGLSIGKEYQKHLSPKWIWYYGADLVPSFYSTNNESYIDNNISQTYFDSRFGLSARPFIGIRFNLHPRLYISAEANASLTYAWSKNIQKYYTPDETVARDVHGNTLNLSVSPASGVFLFYRF
jgi:hypothetical protein